MSRAGQRAFGGMVLIAKGLLCQENVGEGRLPALKRRRSGGGGVSGRKKTGEKRKEVPGAGRSVAKDVSGAPQLLQSQCKGED